MTTVNGSLSLAPVLASQFSAPVAGYLVTLTEAGGATAPDPIAIAVGSTDFSVPLSVGVWTASVSAVDASGNALGSPVVSAPLTLAAPATVLIPVGIALSVAP